MLQNPTWVWAEAPLRFLAERWLALPWARLSTLSKAVVSLGMLVVLVSVAISVQDVRVRGGSDQRSRIVGARALLLGMDPYFFWMGDQTPPGLWDPGRAATIARCTYPPTVLALYALPSGLSYRTQRYLWAGLEWCAMAGAIGALARLCRPLRARLLLVCLALFFFAGGYFWRLHVERGQYYVFLLVLLSMGCWLHLESPRCRWLGTVLVGLAVAFRPTLAVVPVVWWCAGQRRAALTAGATALVAVALTLPWGIENWRQYARAVTNSWEAIEGGNYEKELSQAATAPAPAAPLLAEGYDRSSAAVAIPARTVNMTLPAFLTRSFHWSPNRVSRVTSLGAGAVVLGAMLAGWLGQRGLPLLHQMALAVLPALILDYLVPVRYGYADILLLLPLALLMPTLVERRTPWLLLVLAIGGLAVGHSIFADVELQYWRIGTMARSVGVLTACLGMLWWYWRLPRQLAGGMPMGMILTKTE